MGPKSRLTEFTENNEEERKLEQSHPDYRLPGAMVRRLMRKHGVTIRSLASTHSITMKRVREVRANGVRGFLANEWHRLITGQWLDQANEQGAL